MWDTVDSCVNNDTISWPIYNSVHYLPVKLLVPVPPGLNMPVIPENNTHNVLKYITCYMLFGVILQITKMLRLSF